ncbi:hypothetical protein J7E95_40790 [Streptomyces sp. ISL-14]|nr:hypothetical protein [Streptomyces sp. ISL-14]
MRCPDSVWRLRRLRGLRLLRAAVRLRSECASEGEPEDVSEGASEEVADQERHPGADKPHPDHPEYDRPRPAPPRRLPSRVERDTAPPERREPGGEAEGPESREDPAAEEGTEPAPGPVHAGLHILGIRRARRRRRVALLHRQLGALRVLSPDLNRGIRVRTLAVRRDEGALAADGTAVLTAAAGGVARIAHLALLHRQGAGRARPTRRVRPLVRAESAQDESSEQKDQATRPPEASEGSADETGEGTVDACAVSCAVRPIHDDAFLLLGLAPSVLLLGPTPLSVLLHFGQ